jgi:molecular chaperone DnaK
MTARRPFGPGRSAAGRQDRAKYDEAKPLSPSSRSFADAEAHRSEDAALRAQVDARNELDTVAYQVKRTLDENAGRIPEHERARAELLVSDRAPRWTTRQTLIGCAPLPVSCTSYSNHWLLPPGPAPRLELQLARRNYSDDVIDAEFTTR